MATTFPHIHRDVSWLSFNYRVLQEAKDPAAPLFERIKFLAIYSNNLDEFFRVRVANHRNLLRVGKKTKKKLDYDPKETLKTILEIVNKQQEEFSDIFEKQIVPELQEHKIFLKRRLDLTAEQAKFAENYFNLYMLPYVQPVLLVADKVRPFLNNGALYLALNMRDKVTKEEQYAIVNVPSGHLPRFINLPSPSKQKHLIMLDDIVRHNVSYMFPGYEIMDAYSTKLTRDAELYIDDEFSGDLITKIKESLDQRHVGPASRFVYDREMPSTLLDFLANSLELTKYDLLPEGRYHNNSAFFGFPDFGLDHLSNPPLPPLAHTILEGTKDFWVTIREKDRFVHFPYHSYESVCRFFEEAADDPNVTHIKIIQYRVASVSRIMQALIKAAKAGKQVSAFIEVKARFDEEANLKWGERLEAAGVTVSYSFPGVKVHSKLALVHRIEGNYTNIYTYLSTGNFHENTAKIYSDFGLFTADTRLTSEVARVFTFLETVKVPSQGFDHLLVGQFNLRSKLEMLIDREIENAKQGKEAAIILKMNSLQDEQMIKKLYEASIAGVKITGIIRGICSLVPNIKGVSDNIEIVSIVDRFLEHARVFIFHNEGKNDIYLSSADWMTRNLSYRVETTFPLYDPDVRQTVLDIMNFQLTDNVKARTIDQDSNNEYHQSSADLAIRSQIETYYYIKRQEEALLAEDEAAEKNKKV